VFRLSRPTVVRVAIVRVYPSCERLGSFTIRARAGVNRIRFHGRLRGRPLPPGGYRLVVRAGGARRDAAAIPIVIARGRMDAADFQHARRANVCGDAVTTFGSDPAAPGAGSQGDDDDPIGSTLAKVGKKLEAPVAAAARAIVKTGRGVTNEVADAADDPFQDSFILTLVGAIALVSAILGGIVLMRVARLNGFRHYW
jgi:hypothetical protein